MPATVEARGGYSVVTVAGLVFKEDTQDLSAALAEAERVAYRGVVVDLSGAGIVDSTGVNVITFMNYRLALYLVSYMLGAVATGKYALSVQLAEVLWLISSAASYLGNAASGFPNRRVSPLTT